MDKSVQTTREYYAGLVAQVEAGLAKNVELTPSKAQFALLAAEVEQLKSELMAYMASSESR